MKKFHINYAYSGFLYSPLMLADRFALLPRDAELNDRKGDKETLESLAYWHDPLENWFAVCDPFAVDITKLALPPFEGKPDAVCIVGALVGRLPVWLYSPDSKFERLSSESDLEECKHGVKRIICYKRFNTGYLIGKRINDLMFPGNDKIVEVKFGDELKNIGSGDLVVTSDVLAVAQSRKLNDGHVLFEYFAHEELQLQPFLFTAILTRRSVVNTQLHTVLSVLKGLQEATVPFEIGSVPADWVNFLATRFSDQMPAHLSDSDKRIHAQDAIERLHQDAIYAGNLDIDTAETGYENARQAWLKTLNRKYGAVEKHKEPIPSLLIQRDWSGDPPLARAFAETWKPKPQTRVLGRQTIKGSPVKAVAETWRDHEPTITAITEDWLSSRTTKALLEKIICKPAVAVAPVLKMPRAAREIPEEASGDEQYHPPVVIVGLVLLSLLVVGGVAVDLGGQLKPAGPTILTMGLLVLSGILLVSHWDPQKYKKAFWWVVAAFYVAQMCLTVSIWRDVFFKDETRQWGHHGEILAAIGTIVGILAAPHAAEPVKKNVQQPLKELLSRRRAS